MELLFIVYNYFDFDCIFVNRLAKFANLDGYFRNAGNVHNYTTVFFVQIRRFSLHSSLSFFFRLSGFVAFRTYIIGALKSFGKADGRCV